MAEVLQLTWINLSEPRKEILDRHLQKRIRSHITTHQHEKRRKLERDLILSKSNITGVYGSLVSLCADGRPPQSLSTTATGPSGSGNSDILDDEASNSGEQLSLKATRWPVINIFELSKSCMVPRFFHDPSDELDSHTRRLGANIPDVLKYYGILVDRQGARFRSMSSLPPPTAPQGPKLVPYLTTDPALLAAASLLIIAGMRSFEPHLMGRTEVSALQLRLYVVKSIQKAVDTHNVSDQLILAVGILGVYETIFGRPERYHVHSQGLRDMLQLRGGLQNLGLGGLIEALVLWYDANNASIHGCLPYLDGLPRSTRFNKEGPKVDREHFLCWVPNGRLQQEIVARD